MPQQRMLPMHLFGVAGDDVVSGSRQTAPASAGRNGFLNMPADGGAARVYSLSGRCIGTVSATAKRLSDGRLSRGVYLLESMAQEATAGKKAASGYLYFGQ